MRGNSTKTNQIFNEEHSSRTQREPGEAAITADIKIKFMNMKKKIKRVLNQEIFIWRCIDRYA